MAIEITQSVWIGKISRKQDEPPRLRRESVNEEVGRMKKDYLDAKEARAPQVSK